MDTSVKERLVGGAILVLLVVLIVPAVLTGPRELPPPEPDSQGPTRTVEIDFAGSQPALNAEPEPERDPVPAPEAAVDSPALPAASQGTVAAPPEGVSAPVAGPPAAQQQVPAPAARPEPAAPGSAWAVQVAALASEESARKMVADLRSRGYSAFILEYRTSERVLYRVRVGPEPQRDKAVALASRLQGEGFKATVVAHP
jgi:cell division septation protein DedD